MDTKDDGKKLLISFDNIELDLLKNYPDYSVQFLNEEGFDVDAEGIFGIQQIKKIKFMTQAVDEEIKNVLEDIDVIKLMEELDKDKS